MIRKGGTDICQVEQRLDPRKLEGGRLNRGIGALGPVERAFSFNGLI